MSNREYVKQVITKFLEFHSNRYISDSGVSAWASLPHVYSDGLRATSLVTGG